MAKTKTEIIPVGYASDTVYVVYKYLSTGLELNGAGAFVASPAADPGIAAPQDSSNPAACVFISSASVWPDGKVTRYAYDRVGSSKDRSVDILVDVADRWVVNDAIVGDEYDAAPASVDLLARVELLVKDDSGKITATDYSNAITLALSKYSRIRPDRATIDVTGNGTHDYLTSLLSGWVADFSALRQIEYPVGNVPADVLDDDAFTLYEAPAGEYLRLLEDAPAASETFRVTYTLPHATSATVPANDIDAVASLAASLCLEVLANAWLQLGDSTIAADNVNYRTKSQEAASRAKQMMKLYKDHLGIKDDDSVPAASAVSSREINYPGGADRLTHRRSDRRLR